MAPLMGIFRFVDDADIERLRQHKFTSAGSTPLDDFMDPFWQAIARRIPPWISPNLISVVGGVCAVIASPISIAATRLDIPAFYAIAPALLFVYMTTDAVDGKHARMTGQSSPLGAIVDHGIDAFCAFTTGIAVVNTVDSKLSTMRIMLGFCLFHSSWFCAQWGELELGALDQRGITEGEFATMLVLSLPGLVALDIMSWRIVGQLELRFLVELGVVVGCGAVTLAFLAKVLRAASGRRLQACAPFLHLGLHGVVSVLLSQTPFGRQEPLLTFTVVGMDAALLMTKIRLAATLHSRWPAVHIDMLPFLAVALAHVFGVGVGSGTFYAMLSWQVLSFLMLWHDTITRICQTLNIPFLAAVPQKRA